MFIGLAGTLLGAALGVLWRIICEVSVHDLERLLGTHFLDAQVYFMSDLPAYVEWLDVRAHLRRGLRAVRAGDALSGLARVPHGTRGGAAP